MEKLRISRQKQFCNRLLILLSILLFSGTAFAITPAEIQKLTIRPEQNVYFTNQELKYVLEIPGVAPADVQTQLSENMKEGVNFVSSRRMEFFTDDTVTGTRIEFWFVFRDAGLGVIPPLLVKVKGRGYYLNFDKVELYENPKTIAPRLIVQINKEKFIYPAADSAKKNLETITATVTEPVDLIVYVQYAVQIKQFGYEIPKDSLFEEIERFEMVSGRSRPNEFSQDKIPLIHIKWTPLKEGKFSLPNIRLIATAYSGRNLELGVPECNVNVLKKAAGSNLNSKENISVFAYALSDPIDQDEIYEKKSATEADYYRIAALRSDEKHSFGPSPAIRRERRLQEQSIGIAASLNEQSIPLWNAVTVLFILLGSLTVVLFILRKQVSSIITLVFTIIFASFTLVHGIMITKRHGVVKGGEISPVPENSALSSTAVTAGTCVEIKEETQLWYYIEYNENGGWIKKENLILVE